MTRSILITGCSSGIGRDAATTLAARGWRVFATCRREEDCAALRAEGLESFALDYQDPGSVEAAAGEALERTGGALDAVFNNGAFAIPGPVEDVPREALRDIFECNLFGVHDLTRRVLPAMRARGAGRIVQCSSVLGFAALRFRGAYNATKFALEGLTDTLRLELRHQPIHVTLIQPGPIATRFRVNARPHFERWIAPQIAGSAWARQYEEMIRPRLYAEDPPPDRFELPPSAVTAKLIHALESPRPRARYRVTTPTYLSMIGKRILPTRWFDAMATRM